MFHFGRKSICRNAIITACVAISTVGASEPQNTASPPAFEVASIKPNNAPKTIGGRCRGIDSPALNLGNPSNNVPLGRCILRYMTVKDLIQFAYSQRSAHWINGGPEWIGRERFDVEAKAEDPATTTEATLRMMFRNLLVDQFKLRLHAERREIQGLAIVIGKDGFKLNPSSYSGDRAGTFNMSVGTLVGNAIAIPQLAEELSFWLIKPVLDKTGLARRYDIRLRWTPGPDEVPLPPSPAPPGGARTNAAASDPGDPSMFSAIQQQLGLRLEPQKVPTDFFIVESVEKPKLNEFR